LLKLLLEEEWTKLNQIWQARRLIINAPEESLAVPKCCLIWKPERITNDWGRKVKPSFALFHPCKITGGIGEISN